MDTAKNGYCRAGADLFGGFGAGYIRVFNAPAGSAGKKQKMIDLAITNLRERLKELPFLDVVGGVARPQKIRVGDVEKTLPATPDAETANGYTWLTPDSSKAGIAYFEMLSNSLKDPLSAGRGFSFECRIRCVVWLNTKRLTPTGIAPSAMAAVVSKLQGRYNNVPPVVELIVFPECEAPRGPELFSKYTYDEAETQFLMLPFEYFAFDFSICFAMLSECQPINIVKTDPLC